MIGRYPRPVRAMLWRAMRKRRRVIQILRAARPGRMTTLGDMEDPDSSW